MQAPSLQNVHKHIVKPSSRSQNAVLPAGQRVCALAAHSHVGRSLFEENRKELQCAGFEGARWCQGRAQERQGAAQNAQSDAKVSKKVPSGSA